MGNESKTNINPTDYLARYIGSPSGGDDNWGVTSQYYAGETMTANAETVFNYEGTHLMLDFASLPVNAALRITFNGQAASLADGMLWSNAGGVMQNPIFPINFPFYRIRFFNLNLLVDADVSFMVFTNPFHMQQLNALKRINNEGVLWISRITLTP